MRRNAKTFASVERTVSSVEIAYYVAGLAVWAGYWIERGFKPYMVTFMFRSSVLSSRYADKLMGAEVERIYSRFLTECLRCPWSERNRDNRPILIACQDWPVGKRKKKDQLVLLPEEGPHWGSLLLVPPLNRLKTSVEDHFEAQRLNAYVRPSLPISRIHVEPISYGIELATEYVCKSLVRRRCSIDDLVILPVSKSERSKNS
jgi:hypothetical protein